MENKYLEKFFFIFFSIIPISMILGPSVSLINIIIINFLFIYYLYISKDFNFLKNKVIILLLIISIQMVCMVLEDFHHFFDLLKVYQHLLDENHQHPFQE